MDTSIEFQKVLEKRKTFAPITYREAAVAIANDEQTVLKFMADNDYAQVYRLLHMNDSALVVGENAPFTPSKERVEGELALLLMKGDQKTLDDVISKFVLKPDTTGYTSNQKIIDSLKDIGALVYGDKGYMFTLRF